MKRVKKKHLLQFLDDSIALFQYMVKLRKQAAASGKQTKTKQPKQNVSAAPRQQAAAPQTSNEPQADDKGQYSLGLNENHKLMEELKRIKKIMLS
jgi:plasmid maintenance system killer protein